MNNSFKHVDLVVFYRAHIETNNRISRFALADPEKPVQPLHGYGLLDRPASSTGIQMSLLHTKIRKGFATHSFLTSAVGESHIFSP